MYGCRERLSREGVAGGNDGRTAGRQDRSAYRSSMGRVGSRGPLTPGGRRPAMRPSVNWLLALVPLAIALDRVEGLAPPILFFCAALAIIPLARFIVRATGQIAARSGDAIGGLLNATFGNAPELIISLVAVRAGLLDLVRASIVGAILANLLLAGGVAFLIAGLKKRDLDYNPSAARNYSSMMLL